MDVCVDPRQKNTERQVLPIVIVLAVLGLSQEIAIDPDKFVAELGRRNINIKMY